LVNTIGARVRLTSGSITAAVDRLADKGLVERTSVATDRRARMVRLTTAGREFIERAFAGHEAVMERATGALNPEERAECVRLLKKLGLSAAASALSLP
jgi:MarR family 2-MHQ and catechol resistance regulon transcriptional repressor